MLALRIGLAAAGILTGVLLLQPGAPSNQLAGIERPEPRDAWEKLRQEIQSYRHVHPRLDSVAPEHENQAATHAKTPQREAAVSSPREFSEQPSERKFVQEPVEAMKRTASSAPVKDVIQKSRAQRAEAALKEPSADHLAGNRKRLVRVTTYENGRAVKVRSFVVPSSTSHEGPRHRRIRLACPDGRCRPLTAGMFGPGGVFD